MNKRSVMLTRLMKRSSLVNILLVAALLMPFVAVTPRADAAPRAQPALLALAAQHPEDTVDVIVQKLGVDNQVERLVARLGGMITKDLYIINAFAAEMPARGVAELATAPGVRWVSLDAPVVSRGKADNDYYLYNSTSEGDTMSQAVLPVAQDVPSVETLYNFDTDRDDAPGLVIQRGGRGADEADPAKIQRWRLEAFQTDMQLAKKVEFKFYAAIKGFQKDKKARVWAHLVDVDADGNRVAVIASQSKERKWDDKWKRETIKFEGVNYVIPAGHRIEIAVTVDGASEADMWFAFGTKQQATHLKGEFRNPLTDSDQFYLYNAPSGADGDTPAQPVLPIGYVKPDASTLYNYDTDRDAAPGLVIQKGGSGPDEPDAAKIQRWQLDPSGFDIHVLGDIEVKFHAAVRNFQKDKYGKVWVYLIDRDGDQANVIASGFKEKRWDDQWKEERVEFKDVNYIVRSGHQLEIAFIVDAASEDSMWFAYATHDQPAPVKMKIAQAWPNNFLDSIGAPEAWAMGYQGAGVRVAVVDSGIWDNSPDLRNDGYNRIIHSVGVDTDGHDKYGHGTFMAGIIGSNGQRSNGQYVGVAPQVEMLNVRVSDEWGAATESSVVEGLQWVIDHKDEYNIRIVNLSLASTSLQSYHQSPLDAAVEIVWFNGLVVVVAGGNNGDDAPGLIFPPANDPFVVAVGGIDDMGTMDDSDDIVAEFSAFGTTPEGFDRPDLVAPGTYVISSLADGSHFEHDYKDNQVEAPDHNGNMQKKSFSASGTSVSTAVVSGASALLLEAVPGLNPDQVKWLLVSTATPMDEPGAGAGIVNVARAIQTALSYESVEAIPRLNPGQPISQLLFTGDDPVNWGAVNWGAVNWGAVNWGAVNWGAVNWGAVNWGAVDLDY